MFITTYYIILLDKRIIKCKNVILMYFKIVPYCYINIYQNTFGKVIIHDNIFDFINVKSYGKLIET